MAPKCRAAPPAPPVTPPETFFNRRTFLSVMGLGTLSVPLSTADALAQPLGASKLR